MYLYLQKKQKAFQIVLLAPWLLPQAWKTTRLFISMFLFLSNGWPDGVLRVLYNMVIFTVGTFFIKARGWGQVSPAPSAGRCRLVALKRSPKLWFFLHTTAVRQEDID